MPIVSLDLNSYRNFHAYQVTFSPSFNLILGNNGAGKTTALKIIDALFPFKRLSGLAK